MAKCPIKDLDLFDYAPDYAPRGRATRAKASPLEGHGCAVPIRVLDDWPALVPITDAEVRVVEAHLGDILDELFGPLP